MPPSLTYRETAPPTVAPLAARRALRPQLPHGPRGYAHLCAVAGRACLAVQLGRKPRECLASLDARILLSRGEHLPRRGDLCGVEPLLALELVEVGPGQRERRRPHDLGLPLHVLIVPVHALRRVDLVLRDEGARRQLEDVEPARDL